MTPDAPRATGPVHRSTYAARPLWAKPVDVEPSWIPTDLGNGRTLWRPPPSRAPVR